MDIPMLDEVKKNLKAQANKIVDEKDKQGDALDKYKLEKVETYIDLVIDELVNILLFPGVKNFLISESIGI